MQKAITRLVVLLILFVNQFLVTVGWSPLPFSEDQIFETVSGVATVAVAIWTWYKNNNVTPEAEYAQKYLDEMKRSKKASH